jgi:hypothetical protein
MQQRDNLCGPFHAAQILRDAGVGEWEDEPLDQDSVALHAGTVLPAQEIGPQVPPGAPNLRDYRYELPRVEPAQAGTAPAGLAAAMETMSDGLLRCVPLRGSWDGEIVERLVEGAASLRARLLANVRSGKLWGSRPDVDALLAALDGRAVPGPPPPADWDVGHFIELRSLVRGTGGALVVVRDSYPSLGWMGHHLQPPIAVARALTRGDGHEGGVLVVLAPERVGEIERLASELSLDTEMWDNGTRRQLSGGRAGADR